MEVRAYMHEEIDVFEFPFFYFLSKFASIYPDLAYIVEKDNVQSQQISLHYLIKWTAGIVSHR